MKVTEAKIRANRENAKKPRRALARPLREIMHEILDPVIAKHAFPRLAAILQDTNTAPEVWLRAFECAVDRLGLPRMTQQDVRVSAVGGREVWVNGLGWPEVTGGVEKPATVGDHDDRSDQPSIQ